MLIFKAQKEQLIDELEREKERAEQARKRDAEEAKPGEIAVPRHHEP